MSLCLLLWGAGVGLPGAGVPGPAYAGQEATTPFLTCEDAIRLALQQASSYQEARLEGQLASAEVSMARAALLPRLEGQASALYSSHALNGQVWGPPAFIGANDVTEYQAYLAVAGDLDANGSLRSALARSRELLEAARHGTEVARRALIEATEEAYLGLALASGRRQAAELNLNAARELERITALLQSGAEVAEVDVLRARLQVTTRQDELEQAMVAELAAGYGLKLLIGYELEAPVRVAELASVAPEEGELERYGLEAPLKRPELARLEAQRKAAELEIRGARSERLPHLTYSVNGGLDSDMLETSGLVSHTGFSALIGLSVPVFDWGASRLKVQEARLRAGVLEQQRILAARELTQAYQVTRQQALSARRRINLLRPSVAEAERAWRLSVARYQAGEAPVLEVTEGQSTLAGQRAAFIQALYDYQVNLARLRQTGGP